MSIKVACACGKKLAAKEELAGKKVKCPACQKLLSIPKSKVPVESADDEWDLGDSAEEDFEDEPSEAPAKSRGAKSSAARGSVSRKGKINGKGKKSSGSNRGLLIGLSAGGGVLLVALLTWMLWPAGPADNVAGQPNDDPAANPAPVTSDAANPANSTGVAPVAPTNGSTASNPSATSDNTAKPANSAPPALDAGQPIFTFTGHTAGVQGVAFSPDGKRLASASWDHTVKVWDATAGQELLTLKGHTDQVWGVAFSADGKRLASSGSKTVKVWDAASGQETLTLQGHTSSISSVVFTADGKRLASASHDRTVKVWDTTSGQETLTLKGHTGWVVSVAFSPDGKRLASAAYVLEPPPPAPPRAPPGELKLWDATTGQETLALTGHIGPVTSVAFSPDGKRLASASWDRTVRIWDAMSGQEMLTLKGHTSGCTSVAFSADGKRLASTSFDKTVRVWDATSGQETLTLNGHTKQVTSVVFSPDGQRLASASPDKTVKVWDVSNRGNSTTVVPSAPPNATNDQPASVPATNSGGIVTDGNTGVVPRGTNFSALVPNGQLPPALTQLPDWLVQEAPFDVQKYWAAVPPEQNAAPLYLDALYEFAPHMELYFPPADRASRTAAANSRAQRSVKLQIQWQAPSQRDLKERDAVAQLHAAGFQKLIEAQKRPDCQFEVSWDVPTQVLIPLAAREVARVAEFQVAGDLERGDFDAAIRTIGSLLRLSRDLRKRTPMAFHFMADGVFSVTIQYLLIPTLKSPGLKASQCDELLRMLVRHEASLRDVDPFLMSLRGDYVLKRMLLHDFQHQTGEFAEARYRQAYTATNATRGAALLSALNPSRFTMISFGTEMPKPALGAQMENLLKGMKPADFEVSVAYLKEKYQVQADAMKQPFAAQSKAFGTWHRKHHDALQSLVPPNTPREQSELVMFSNLDQKSLRGVALAMLFQSKFENDMSESFFAHDDVRLWTRLSGAQALVALRRWYGTQAKPPPDIAVVCREAGLADVPRDPYGDGPLRMATFAADTPIQHYIRKDLKMLAGETVIYSVNTDGVDDKALKDSDGPFEPGDWLFRLEIPEKAIPVTPAPAAAPIQSPS
ncbi:MAG: WD40 repeat domain-containing protein [Planctomycetaceae bacterium]